jgi:hypothetical protein
MPRKAKKKATAKSSPGRRSRRSREEVQSLLEKIHAEVAGGATITDTLKKAGVSYSNYNYWKKREGRSAVRRGSGAGRSSGSVVALLREMTENRRQAEALRKNLAVLDDRFARLKRQLEKTSV